MLIKAESFVVVFFFLRIPHGRAGVERVLQELNWKKVMTMIVIYYTIR